MIHRFIFITTLLFGALTSGYAQDKKRPQIQQNSIWMENFEADGKLDEWGEPLEAYNTDTHIAYSLANDEDYLYLAVKSNRTEKIFNGGVTLEIITAEDGQVVSVVFPYDFTYDRRTNPRIVNHPDKPRMLSDLREIEVDGIAPISTKTISTVNEFGVLVGISSISEKSSLYEDGEPYYIVEFAVPLQYYGVMDHHEQTLDYRIKLRGIIPYHLFGGVGRLSGNILTPEGQIVRKYSDAQIEDIYQKEADLYRQTELTGTYRLASKPE